jgi:nitrous oxidase accessory protein
MKKQIVLIVIILFFGMTYSPFSEVEGKTHLSPLPFFSSTFFVGGNGPNNYTTIQAAINHATDGDYVFVFDDSSPYYEHVIVNKSIYLIGENKNTTVIDGEGSGDVILLSAEAITITGFTVQHSGDTPKVDAGLEVRTNWSAIIGNNIIQNGRYGVGILLNGSSGALIQNNFISENGNEGIFLEKSTGAIIRDNIITHNGHCAVVISYSNDNTIDRNTMQENYAGISLWPGASKNDITLNIIENQTYSGVGIWPEANNNSIHDNVFTNNSLYGFIITNAQGNIIASNRIQGSNEGIRLFMANKTIFQYNNFIKNNCSAFFENSSFNRWRQNYWDDHIGIWPKCIHGLMRIPWNKIKVVRWINIDWSPALNPYNISSVGAGGE